VSDLEPTVVSRHAVKERGGRGGSVPEGGGGLPRSGGFPGWVWVLAFFGGAALCLMLSALVFLYFFAQRPALRPVATPTITLLTVPAPTLTDTPAPPTPGPTPTETPLPTATLPAPPPGTLTIGVTVQVVNTGGAGLNLREGPGTDNPRVAIAIDGELLEVADGPQVLGGFTWWLLKRSDGVQGWGVQNFLQLAP
jgi:hypothetical protein